LAGHHWRAVIDINFRGSEVDGGLVFLIGKVAIADQTDVRHIFFDDRNGDAFKF
jgi:hypothetical protein